MNKMLADDLHDCWAVAEWLEELYESSDGDSTAWSVILIKSLVGELARNSRIWMANGKA